MISGKISSEKSKASRTHVTNPPSKSKKSEGLKAKNSPTKMYTDRDVAEMVMNNEFGEAFEKFWKSVTDGIDRKAHDTVPRNTQIDNKISEMQKRIRLNQAILKNANERMKGISFATERQNLTSWKEGLTYRNLSRNDLNRFKNVKALDLELQKLRESKPDRNVFLRSSPGIVNFHETMENTLSMLNKIQNADELEDYEIDNSNAKKTVNLEFIKAPELVLVSDEE